MYETPKGIRPWPYLFPVGYVEVQQEVCPDSVRGGDYDVREPSIGIKDVIQSTIHPVHPLDLWEGSTQ